MSLILALLPPLALIMVPMLVILFFAYRLKYETPVVAAAGKKKITCYHVLVWSAVVIFYVALAMLLSTAWVRGDDWLFLNFSEGLGLKEKFTAAMGRYLAWVARGGEFYGTLLGVSFSRWENWLVTPIFAVAAPFAFFALVKKKGESIFSLKGFCFYLIVFCLCLLGVHVPVWRNYWCFAAAVNYITPTVLGMWFLSFFRTDGGCRKSGILTCLAVFSLGVLSGWGTECMTATVLPLLSIWVFYNLFSRKNVLPLHSYWGYAGFLFGSFALFGSPALYTRNKIVADSLGSYLTGMTPEQLNHFLYNLDSAAVESLRGASGIITLKDIPLLKHIFFVPYMSELFLSCCIVALVVFTVLFVLYLCQRERSRYQLALAAFFMLVSWVCAFSYLVQCIPLQTSFLPPCFIMIAGCAYLLLRVKYKFVSPALALILTGMACAVFVPAGVEGWEYKKYERIRHEKILELKRQGVMDIVLDRPYPIEPEDTISLIRYTDLRENPKNYPNGHAAQYYGVNSISQKEPVKK